MRFSPSLISLWTATAVLGASAVFADETNKKNIRGHRLLNVPDWANNEGTEDNEEEARVIIEYTPGDKEAMKQDIDDADIEDERENAGFAWAITTEDHPEKGYKMNYEFDSINAVVVTSKKRKIKNLAKRHSRHMVSMSIDEKRYVSHIRSGMEESVNGHRGLDSLIYSDSYEGNQMLPYGIQMVEAQQVWDAAGSRGTTAKVCVVDSGTYKDSPDFISDNLTGDNTPNGESLQGGGVWSVDACKHGTHVAGTIAAEDDNLGVVGVAPDTKVHTIKVFHGTGCGWSYTSGLIAATGACKDAGADIINMSLGGGGFSGSEATHYANLIEEGMLIVAAAGNGGNNEFSYPASYDSVMSVAAVDSSSNRVSFSQYNSQVDIAAPGSSVYSVRSGDTSGGNRLNYSGTSMASPHVAGVAALLYDAFSSSSIKGTKDFSDRIREAIENSALDRGSPGRDNLYGHGIVKAKAAYDCLSGTTSLCTTMPGMGSPVPTPVPAPVPAPVPLPTPPPVSCFDGVHKLQYDYYSEETSWSVMKSDTKDIIAEGGNGSRRSYQEAGLTCMEQDEYYHYTINDTYGDGVCCLYGVGFYELHSNGLLVTVGGSFEDSEEVLFRPNPAANDNELRMEYKGDSWPAEFSWKMSTIDALLGERPFGTYNTGGEVHTVNAFFPVDRCVTVDIYDSWGDGITSGGYLKLSYNGYTYFDFGQGRADGNFATAARIGFCSAGAMNTMASEAEEGSTIIEKENSILVIPPGAANTNPKKPPKNNNAKGNKAKKKGASVGK